MGHIVTRTTGKGACLRGASSVLALRYPVEESLGQGAELRADGEAVSVRSSSSTWDSMPTRRSRSCGCWWTA
jgi:hypothetical protein